MIASNYPFLDVLWTMFVIFLWIIWFSLLFKVFGDIFRRNDLSGWGKTGWLILTIVLPFLGVFIYLITQSEGMTQRAQIDDYVRTTAGSAGGATAEIEKAKQLLDTGTINQAEFEALKQKALA